MRTTREDGVLQRRLLGCGLIAVGLFVALMCLAAAVGTIEDNGDTSAVVLSLGFIVAVGLPLIAAGG